MLGTNADCDGRRASIYSERRTGASPRPAGPSLRGARYSVCRVVALTLGLMLWGGSTAWAASSFSWSAPQPVITGGASGITHLACAPGSTLCVGGDYFDGDIAASANVTSGANEWITGNIDGRTVNSTNGASESTITGVACPSTTLCIATDDSGHILVSEHPAESTASWSKALPAASEGHALNSPTCPTTALCLVADSNGTVLTSTNPAGGAGTWTATKLAITPAVVGCETTTLCVAVSTTGQIVTSTEPTGGESKWSSATATVNASHTPTAISCATGLCAFVDDNGDVVSATEPAGGASKWASAEIDSGEYMRAISCPSSGLCIADGSYSASGPGVYYATNPHGTAGEWTRFAPPAGEFGTEAGVEAVACPSTSLCVASLFGGGSNAILTNTTPTVETATWAKTELKEPAGLSNVSCASNTLCVAIESNSGNVLTSTTPSVEGSEWKRATISTDVTPLDGISCVAGSTLCVAIDGSGNVFTSTEPNGGASKWTKTAIPGAEYLSGISCPTTSFCAIVDESSHVITSTAPTSGVWHVSEPLPSNQSLLSVSCPSSSFCAAIEVADGKVFTSTSPAGAASTWTPTELEGASYLDSISCASATLCVTGGQSNEYATNEPTGGASKWTKEAIGWITDASCPSESLCVDSGYFGEIFTSASPTEGVSAWSSTHVDFYERGMQSVSCPTTSFCAAVDGYGADVITGSALGPVNTAPPKIGGEAVVGKTLTEEHGSWSGGSILGYTYEWQRCTGGVAHCFRIAGAESQTLALTSEDDGFQVRVLESARDAEGTSPPTASALTPTVAGETVGGTEESHEGHEEPKGAGGSGGSGGSGATAMTAQVVTPVVLAPVVAVPVVGQRQTVSPVSGTVLVRVKGASGFVALSAATSITEGSEVEATNGRVTITVATPTGTQSAEVYGGRFVVEQEHGGSDETRFVLSLPLTGCPRVALPRGASAASAKHGPKSRHLWVSESGGSWGTNGRYVSTTVEGTHWLTQDECNQSEVQVLTGKVKVNDLVTHKTKTLTAGQHYTTKRR
jgi:hypothetical protein